IALPQYQKAVEKAKAAEVITWVGNAKRAIGIYLMQNGLPPDNLDPGIGYSLLTQGVWDIDLTSGLTCDETRCRSKNFSYEITFHGGRVELVVWIFNNENERLVKMSEETRDGRTWYNQWNVYYAPEGKRMCEVFEKTFNISCTSKH
ncbi:MAG: hypothetical protein J6V32_00780, partial [Elusimicrobiaceae bacterium]|nr:hypothetical protein [Elusimicrobiaceae bacterium]